jgi:hypothetical protein
MANKSGGGAQTISLPQGGGALHGIGEKFSPDLYTGTGNFTVPIALPPGRNGFQPQLNLAYSSGNGNGPFGLGWTLNVPGVALKTSKGIPRCQGADTYILSGAEDLVAVHDDPVSSLGVGWAWGDNAYGALGDGGRTNRSAPAQMNVLTDAVTIAAGSFHNLALWSDGSVWAWGANSSGQLGDGATADRLTPARMSGLGAVTALGAGWDHSLALKVDGTVWAWGGNTYGQLGLGTTQGRLSPVQVHGLDRVVALAAGKQYSLALREDGTVWSWGYGMALGDGVGTTRLTPGPVAGLSGVTAIAAGG